MQQLKRIKKYKSALPLDTVGRIKDILKSNGIETSEVLYENKDAGVYSCNVYISNSDFKGVQFSTNGKGMTREYSLASGYAELMERLQNGIIFGLEAASEIGTYSVEQDKSKEIIKDFFKTNFGENEKASDYFISRNSDYKVAEFVSVGDNEKIEIPLEILLKLATSNGMCAGNDFLEAVLQGSSEIIERYAQKKIIMDRLCPPVIDDEYFKEFDVYEKLKLLKEKGVYYEVRDCSLGVGLPVIGIYMSLEDGRELFHLGADPSPVTGLERCITEIFQGVDKINDAEFHEKEDGYNDEIFWKYQMLLCSWGGNVYPKELSGKDYSWEFCGFAHPKSVSNEDDFNYYRTVLGKLGKKIYVRDVSYLGFPSYMCYIPGMSILDFSFDEGEEITQYYKYMDKLKSMRRLPKLNKRELTEFAETLKEFLYEFEYYEQDQFINDLYPHGNFEGIKKDYYLHLASIFASAGLYSDAAQEIENYVLSNELTEEEEEKYFEYSLSLRRGKGRKHTISKDDYPVCTDCRDCRLKDDCIENNVNLFVCRLSAKADEYRMNNMQSQD